MQVASAAIPNNLSTSDLTQIVPIFSGGGTRLSAHIGIIKALHDMKIGFDTLVGVSGGSIIASLYAKGYSVEQMRELALVTDFKQFTEFSLVRLLREGGLSSGDVFQNWIDEQLEGAVFADMPLDLNILATDVNGGGPVLFNKHATPDMKVSEAVRYSMSIPLIFSFKPFKEYLLVDGAILSEDALFEDWRGDGTPSVCFRLQSTEQKRKAIKKNLLQLPQYVGMLIRTFMTAISREYVNAKYWHNTVVVNTGEVSAVDFSLTPEIKNTLFELGYSTTKEFLPKKCAGFMRSSAFDVS
ncbi:phospholipase [Alteromonas mediterranea]|uniref:Patatin n=1 Tax=Alteromonas mediterranea 615 TaxID=1300253 RepID=S5AH82_9ALTE|nr:MULTISPECIES: patatin-like phospholipase family protein [Alteromonas]AGP78694.1 patatin [Alteromonas mediterranea 615]MBR9895082.1 phospholipase [Gammaproteobacteria bacterium]MDY6882876.1 patatin-like phospholipase family protein [Pseudomonadota bacterium]APE02643.1 phospholipase [Alteromonas mediterranea]NQY19032.1 patatin-like phospholipase family protein [Alteromonas sp.]